MTVFCCVAIIVFGITFLTKADPITTSIGENISTNDLSVAGLLDVGGDSNLSGNVYVAGLLDVTGNSTVGGTLDVTGDTTLRGDAGVTGDAAIGGDLDVSGNSTLDGTLGVTGDATLSGDVNVGGDLTVSGSTSFGNASFSGIDNILYVDGIAYAQNSTGIQAAIDAVPATGGKIILPAGTYSITATIIIAKSNVLLEGVGESTKLVLANGVNASVMRIGDGASAYSNIKISSLQIDGNKANNAATSYGIYFQGAVAGTIEYPAMESVYIHDMYDAAVRITYSNKGIFKNNKLYNNGQAHGEGFLATDSSNCIFDGNIFQSNRDNPIYLFGGANNIISNNQIVSNGDYGFYIRDTSKVQIINNVMNSCIYGVEVYTSNNIQITGNAITGNQENGVRLYRSSYNIIKGNTFKDNGIATNAAYYDIYLTDDSSTFSTYNIIEGNNIRATAANKTNYGIYENAAGDDYNTIQNNTINGPVAGSVRALGAHTTVSGNKTASATEGLFDVVASSGATQTVLLVTQNGTGDIVDFKDGASSVFKISDGGNVTMSGNLTTSSINNILYVDGTKYAQNSTGIQSAIDALPVTGGKIVLPAGTYNVTATIIINKSNVTLEGMGDASKLYLVNGTNANVINVGTGYGTSAFSDIAIVNLQIDGNRANNNSFEGIKFNSDISNSRVENCYIHDTYYNGIYVYNSSGNFFKGNRINNTTSGGIVVSVGSKNIIESNKMVNIGGSAINIGGGANANNYNSIIGNYIEGSGQMFSYPGVYLAEGANNTVTGNVFYNNRCQAIYTYRTSYNTITSNTITGSSQSGNNTYSDIYLYSSAGVGPSTYNIVSNNTINATGATKSKYGIEESDANNDYNTIQNNIINGPATGNIHTLGAHDTVSGNKTSSAAEGLFDIVANSGATQTALSVTQNGVGKIVDFKAGSTSLFSIAANGNVTTSSINNTLYIDGAKYTRDQSGIQNAIDDLPSTGGKVILPAGTYNLDSNLDAAIAYDGGVYTDETSAANDVTANDMTLLPSSPQVDDAYYFGFDYRVRGLSFGIGTAGVGAWTIAWEYWNGSVWTPLNGVTDSTSGFTAAGYLVYAAPSDWTQTSVNSNQKFYIRARVSSFTSVTTAPRGTQAYSNELITIDKSGVTLEGVGEGTKLSAGGVNYLDMIYCPNVSDITISNMEINGNDSQYGIFFNGTTYSKVENNYIHNTVVSVYLMSSNNNIVTKNKVVATGGEGMRVNYSSTNIISENMISGSGQEAVGVWGSYGPTVNNYDNVINKNVLEGNENGIWMGRWAPRTIISDNIIRNNLNNGIDLRTSNPYDSENLRSTLITGNEIYGNAYNGIFLEGWGSPFDHISIADNTVNNNGWNGIAIQGGRYMNISGNHLFNNSQATASTYAELLFDSSDSESGYNNISDNMMTESATNKAKYGIRETNTSENYNYYSNNQVSGAVTANISLQGANNANYANNSITLSNGEKIDNATDGRISITGDLTPASNISNDLGTIAMDTTADVTATGIDAGEGLGFSLSGAGDVNADGYADVVAGSIWGSKAYVFLGGSTMDATPDVTITGSSDRMGISVSSAGDVNGDGYGDIIVGASLRDTTEELAGQAYIFYGGSSMDNVADVTLSGEAYANYFGSSVANAGDLNGDGFSDVIVGADFVSKVYIFYGGSSMDNVPDIILNGEGSTDYFGASISAAGDVNGDGFGDIIIGADVYSSLTGRTYIFYGGPNMDAAADVIMTGETVLDGFGGSVSSASDLNGDGYDDVVVGASNYGATDAGRAYVYYGGAVMNNVADVTMTGTSAYGLGSSVASAGDINSDGYADLFAGAIWGYRAYVYYGGAAMNNVADVTLTGTNGTGFGGFDSVANVGDTNGDGYSDLAVGAPYYSSSLGRFYIYRGSGVRWESIFAQNANLSKGIQVGGLFMDEYGINTYSRFGIFTPNWTVSGNGSAGFQDLAVGGNVSIGSTGSTSKLNVAQNGVNTALSVVQSGTGDIVDFKDGATSVFKITDGGNVIMSGNLTTSSINNTLYVDGTKYTQDSTGIQAAINALPAGGGKVILPAGNYNIATTVNILKSNVILEGVGESTKLLLANNINQNVIQVGDGTNPFSNVNIASLQVDGNYLNNASYTNIGIYIQANVTKTRIENNFVHNVSGALIQVSGGESIVTGNILDTSNRQGIFLITSSHNTVSNNLISNTVGQRGAIHISDGSYNTVTGNTMKNNDIGIAIEGSYNDTDDDKNNTVSGNTIENSNREGVYVYRADYNIITGNTIRNSSQVTDNTYSDIALTSYEAGANYCNYNIISGNIIQESGAKKAKYGISEENTGDDYNTIQNNIIKGPATGNIHTLGAHDTVSGNKTSSVTEGLFDVVTSPGATQTALSVTQNGAGNIADFKDRTNSVFKISAAGNVTMNALSFTQNAVSPVYVGSVINSSYMDSPFGIDYANNYAYVTGLDSNSLSIVDVSKPTSPVLVGSLVDNINMDYAFDVKVVGKYAYVSGQGSDSLSIIDVSNPITPVLVGSISDYTNLAGATGIYISGKYAYVANRYGSSMAIVDISNPAAPAVTGSLSAWQMDGATSIYVQGNYAYVVGYSSAVLSVIDISNPASPTGVGSVYSADYMLGAYDVKVAGKYAYVVGYDSDSLAIVDISNPAVPAVVGHLVDSDNMDGPGFLDVSGKYAYVTADNSNSLSVIDVSNPAAPVLSGLLVDPTHMSEPTGITISGKYAYVGSFDQDALSVLEISGFDLPSANIGDLKVGTLDVAENASVANNLYVGNGLNVGIGGIYSVGDMYTGGNLSVAGSIYQPVYNNDDGLVMNLDFSENVGPELLVDPGVENWTSATNLTNWGEYGVDATHTVTRESTDKRSGTYSVKLEQSAATAKEFTIEQDVAAEPNTTYQLNGYVKYASRTAGEVYISAWDGTNWKEEDLSAVTSSYQFVSLRFTTSATADYIEFAVSMYGETGASAVAYLDDFSLKKIDTATAYDKSPYANDCAITNASFTNGKYGQGMQFDGIDNRLNCGASDSLNFNGTKEFTIGFWTYLNGSTNMDFLSKYDWGGYNGYAVIRTTDEIILAVGHGDGTYTETDTPISSEGWHYVAYTATASELKGYMDGELRATTPLTKSIVYSSDALYFGAPDWQANPLNASLDELRIYNRALPEDEIRTQYSGSADAHSVVRADQFRIIDMNNNIPFLIDTSGDVTMTGNLNVEGFITNLPATAISTEGLVGYWPLDGNVKDYSSGGNNGTNYDGVFTSSGKVGGAYTFDGSTSYIDAGTGLSFTDAITVEAWVNMADFNSEGAASQRILVKRIDDTHAFQLDLDTQDGNNFSFQVNDGVGEEYGKVAYGFSTGTWYHVVGTYDRTNRARLYVDAVAATEDFGGNALGSTNSFILGMRGDIAGHFHGSMDEVRVYHRALSEAEIKQHYNADATLLQGESYLRKSGDSMYGGLDIVDNSINFSSYEGGLFDRITLTGDGDGTHLYCADNDSGDGIHFQNTAGLEQMFIDNATGNVGIGTIQPNPSAALDITSTTKGLLPPRLTTAQRDAISAPATGLLIYNTTTNKLNFYNGAAWEIVTSAP